MAVVIESTHPVVAVTAAVVIWLYSTALVRGLCQTPPSQVTLLVFGMVISWVSRFVFSLYFVIGSIATWEGFSWSDQVEEVVSGLMTLLVLMAGALHIGAFYRRSRGSPYAERVAMGWFMLSVFFSFILLVVDSL